MKKQLTRFVIAFLSSCLVSLAANPVRAEDNYPSRVIKIEVPFAAGGTGDQFARILGRKMQEVLGQNVIIENRTGAASNIGMSYVARSAPDGYTLLMAGQPLTVNPSLYQELPYKLSDFAPIALKAPDVIKELAPTGIEIAGSSPQDFAAFIEQNYKQNAKLIKAVGTSWNSLDGKQSAAMTLDA